MWGAAGSYEAERRAIVESTQRAAQASLEWFEGIARYVDQARTQFAFNLLTRSRRVTYDNLRLRDPEFVREVDQHFQASLVDSASASAAVSAPASGAGDGAPPSDNERIRPGSRERSSEAPRSATDRIGSARAGS